MFTVPSLVPIELAERCGVTEIAEGEVNMHARVEVLKRLKYLEKAVEDSMVQRPQAISQIYDAVKHKDPSSWARTTVADVASLLYSQTNIIKIFATHKFLMDSPTYFLAHPYHLAVQTFNVRPQTHVEELQMMRMWTRQRNGPIQEFGDKARTIIQNTQPSQDQPSTGPPRQSKGNHSWTSQEKVILSFLLRSLRPYRSSQSDPYSLGQSAVLKAINLEGLPVDDDGVQMLLTKLGVIAPWQDLQVLSPDLDLDLENESSSARVKKTNAIVARALSAPQKQGPLGPEDFYPSDPLESVRHDFGDVPVFVIDDSMAEELDDGFSIERIPSEPDKFWVHIHIADPASIIPPTHVLAQNAAKQQATMYFSHRSWPLFPKSLMQSPKHGLSLGARKDLPSNVLTFSAKVNDSGDIIDFKVRAGLIRNIIVISYEAVNHALSLPPAKHRYPFGGKLPEFSLPTLSELHVKDLRDLMLLSDRLTASRYRDGAFIPNDFHGTITGFQRISSDIHSPTLMPSVFDGFPEFEYSVVAISDTMTGSRALVAEMMKLACRVASRFCLEHNIPALRRVSGPPILTSATALQKLLDMRMPNTCVPFEEVMKCLVYQPAGEYSLEPKEHVGLTVREGEGYVRCTSPLRRYLDLVAHWQLHCALLGPAASANYPFSSDKLSDLGIAAKVSEKIVHTAVRVHERYWLTAFIKRWKEDTERGVERRDDPLKRLNAITTRTPAIDTKSRTFQVEAVVPLLGVRVHLVNLEDADIPTGTVLPVEIRSCRLGIRPLITVVRK